MVREERAKARREQAQAQARAYIVEAALGLFAQKGYNDTKISDIAEAAGYTPASLYTYFSGKKAIFAEAASYFADTMIASFSKSPPEPAVDFEALDQAVRAHIHAIMDFAHEKRDVLAFFLRLGWQRQRESTASKGPQTSNEIHARIERASIAHWEAVGVQKFGLSAAAFTSLLRSLLSVNLARDALGLDGEIERETADTLADFALYGLRGKR